MRKTILTALLLSLTIILTGCSADLSCLPDNYRLVDNEYIDFELVKEDGGQVVVYDKHTKVLYLIMHGYEEGAITPIYNADGSLKLYE